MNFTEYWFLIVTNKQFAKWSFQILKSPFTPQKYVIKHIIIYL